MNSKTLLAAVFVLFVIFKLVNGFATTKCDHAELKGQSKKLSACMETTLDKYIDLLKIYNKVNKIFQQDTKVVDSVKACNVHKSLWKELKKCYNGFTTTCLDAKMTDLGNEFHSMFEVNCDAQNITKSLNETRINNFDKKIKEIVGAGNEEEYFKSLVTMDKSCDIEREVKAIGNEKKYYCFVGILKDFILQDIKKDASLGKYFDKNDVSTIPNYVSPCKMASSLLFSCFNENDCFSQQEMDLVRELVSWFYKWVMKTSITLTDSYGGVRKGNLKLRETKLKWNKQEWLLSKTLYEDLDLVLETKIITAVEFAIKDFKSDECKGMLPKSWSNASGLKSSNVGIVVTTFVLLIVRFIY
jgi:hypothetical protein